MTLSWIVMDDFLDLRRLHNARCYFTAIVIFASIYLFGVLLFDLLQVQIYRHDALYYRSLDEYLYNVKTEGRWVNYLLYPHAFSNSILCSK